MGDTQNFIEINGKKYDAATGVMLESGQSLHVAVNNVSKPVVDGFVKRVKPVGTEVRRPATRHIQTPQKSQTLMRSAVKKPTQPLHISGQPNKPAATVFGKATIQQRTANVPEHRQKLATSVEKSSLVQKFGSIKTAVAPKLAHLEVRPAPAIHAEIVPNSTSVQQSKTADLLEKALQAAEGHTEPYHKYKKRFHHKIADRIGISGRAAAISLSVVAALLFGGFYAYENVPKLAMKVAASRAGFNASMPNYSPAGFAFSGPVQYASGQVTIGFKSNTDNRQYKVTQQTTDWTSDTLLSNFIEAGNKTYQTYQDRGKTIYIYDNTNATWVQNGVWYQIEGKSDLTTDQLVRIASSL